MTHLIVQASLPEAGRRSSPKDLFSPHQPGGVTFSLPYRASGHSFLGAMWVPVKCWLHTATPRTPTYPQRWNRDGSGDLSLPSAWGRAEGEAAALSAATFSSADTHHHDPALKATTPAQSPLRPDINPGGLKRLHHVSLQRAHRIADGQIHAAPI